MTVLIPFGALLVVASVLFVVGRREPYPWAWGLPAFVVIAATVLLGFLRRGAMPDRIAIHFDFAGVPDRLVPATGVAVFSPVLIQVGMTLLLAGVAAVTPRPRPAYGLSQALLLMAACFDVGLYFLARRVWHGGNLDAVTVVEMICSFAVGLVGLLVAVVSARRAEPVHRPRDDERNWRGGVFYVNPGDPDLLVPKRFGIGWTLNFGHRAAWVVLGVLLALPLLTAVVSIFEG